MQPFASDVDANYLGWINRLARIDRHRRLTIWAARIVTADPITHIPSGVEPRWEWGERMLESGYCDLARLTFPDSESAEGVSVNPRLTIDPEISEWGNSPFYAERKFDERLRRFMAFVLAEIDTYDYDCTGNLEARRSLTEEFAEQCDERRSRIFKNPTPPARSTPHWTPATLLKSSRERYFGGELSHKFD